MSHISHNGPFETLMLSRCRDTDFKISLTKTSTCLCLCIYLSIILSPTSFSVAIIAKSKFCILCKLTLDQSCPSSASQSSTDPSLPCSACWPRPPHEPVHLCPRVPLSYRRMHICIQPSLAESVPHFPALSCLTCCCCPWFSVSLLEMISASVLVLLCDGLVAVPASCSLPAMFFQLVVCLSSVQ